MRHCMPGPEQTHLRLMRLLIREGKSLGWTNWPRTPLQNSVSFLRAREKGFHEGVGGWGFWLHNF